MSPTVWRSCARGFCHLCNLGRLDLLALSLYQTASSADPDIRPGTL